MDARVLYGWRLPGAAMWKELAQIVAAVEGQAPDLHQWPSALTVFPVIARRAVPRQSRAASTVLRSWIATPQGRLAMTVRLRKGQDGWWLALPYQKNICTLSALQKMLTKKAMRNGPRRIPRSIRFVPTYSNNFLVCMTSDPSQSHLRPPLGQQAQELVAPTPF